MHRVNVPTDISTYHHGVETPKILVHCSSLIKARKTFEHPKSLTNIQSYSVSMIVSCSALVVHTPYDDGEFQENAQERLVKPWFRK
jgi:hypothetical protein|mmetsp:Transcript_79480/g.133118  ORF Transcript_79480/g.133118 Transcript_79480/m.133118 type:complete len:86 (-) Transcript_79480:983-1240(-)